LSGKDFDRLRHRPEQNTGPAEAEIKDSQLDIGQLLPADGAAFEQPRDS
jgi:hypothetical protein